MRNFIYLRYAKKLLDLNPDAYRLLSKAKINNETGCWEWTASKAKGYGRFKFRGKFYGSHQVSYMLFIGEIKEGMNICHKCDNPKCINPDHLFQGTQSENMIDCSNKNRLVVPEGKRYKNGHIPKNSKLDIATVLSIRNELELGNLNMKAISNKFNVKHQTVRDIKGNRSYINIKI